MKRSVIFLFIAILVSMLSGCILSKTQSTDSLTMNLGEQKTFSVNIFPSNATYTWTLDEAPISNSGKSYTYTALAGGHYLIVRATHILGTDTKAWHIYGNSPPVANAGADQRVSLNTIITIDGSGSTDTDNDIVSYQWEQTGGPTVTLTNANTATAHFTSSVVSGSTLTFSLTVTDSGGLTSTDICVIFVIMTFNKTYGGSDLEIAHTVQQTSDGGYILAAATENLTGYRDFWLIKTDANGNEVWNRTFGGNGSEEFQAIQQTSNGGYILAGTTESYGTNVATWLIKTDADGNKVWDKTFGESSGGYAVEQTNDGGYILAGTAYGSWGIDAWLIKTDADGNAPATPTP